jgi:MFS family permease
METHPLFVTIKNLKGNTKPVVLTEPIWGIPYNLYYPYLSIYMLANGLNDSQVGLVTSIGLVFQIFFAAIGGIVTDKLGRRLTVLIFDILSWSTPCVIWAFSRNIYAFAIGMALNAFWRVSNNAWPLLLAEDADPRSLVDIYSWIYIFSVSVALFTPLTGLLINRYSLIPALKWILIASAGIMMIKFIVLYHYSHETKQGEVRRAETRDQNVFAFLAGYRPVIKQVLNTPATLFTIGVLLISTICNMISGTFWSIYVTKRLGISPERMSFYPFMRAIFILAFFFFAMPYIRKLTFKIPMLVAYAGYFMSQLILVLLPPNSFGLLIISVFLEACSFACLSPQIDRLIIVTVDPHERARIVSIIAVVVLIVTSPFGWIGGLLSQADRTYPFILNMVLFAIGGILTYLASRRIPDQPQEDIVHSGD